MPTVISDWNVIAVNALLGDPGKKPQESFLYLGFVDAAVYDAVVGIQGRYRPYACTPVPLTGPPSRPPRWQPPMRSW